MYVLDYSTVGVVSRYDTAGVLMHAEPSDVGEQAVLAGDHVQGHTD